MLGKHTEENWSRYYMALKDHDPDLFRRCLQAGNGVSMTHNLNHKVAADVEENIVLMVCDALGITI